MHPRLRMFNYIISVPAFARFFSSFFAVFAAFGQFFSIFARHVCGGYTSQAGLSPIAGTVGTATPAVPVFSSLHDAEIGTRYIATPLPPARQPPPYTSAPFQSKKPLPQNHRSVLPQMQRPPNPAQPAPVGWRQISPLPSPASTPPPGRFPYTRAHPSRLTTASVRPSCFTRTTAGTGHLSFPGFRHTEEIQFCRSVVLLRNGWKVPPPECPDRQLSAVPV